MTLARTGIRRRSPMKSRYRSTGPTPATIEALRIRSHGRCEFPNCDQPAQDPHHRYERSSGGVGPKGPGWINDLSNLLAACRHHNDWCSNQQPAKARAMGWIVTGLQVPRTTPVETAHTLTAVYLDDEGGWDVDLDRSVEVAG